MTDKNIDIQWKSVEGSLEIFKYFAEIALSTDKEEDADDDSIQSVQ
jgi:hypothetical protein